MVKRANHAQAIKTKQQPNKTSGSRAGLFKERHVTLAAMKEHLRA